MYAKEKHAVTRNRHRERNFRNSCNSCHEESYSAQPCREAFCSVLNGAVILEDLSRRVKMLQCALTMWFLRSSYSSVVISPWT